MEWYDQGQEGRILRENEETLGVDGYVHYFNFGDDFTSVDVCQNLANICE